MSERQVVAELRDAGFDVLTRSQWATRHADVYKWRREHRAFEGRAADFFAHVTVTNPSGDFAADVRLVEQIGFERFESGISYNWCVDQETGAIAVGQPLDAAGTHTVNDKGVAGFPAGSLNYYGHAIAWIGNVGDKPSQKCKESFAAIIAAEKKHGAAAPNARLFPHSKFAWKECPLAVMADALPWILNRSNSILEGDWFDMATLKELREVVDAALEAERPRVVAQVKRELWAETDVFPGDDDRNASLRQALYTLLTRSDPDPKPPEKA